MATPEVHSDDFIEFLYYLAYTEGFTISQIIDAVGSPHKFRKEYDQFLIYRENEDSLDYNEMKNFINDGMDRIDVIKSVTKIIKSSPEYRIGKSLSGKEIEKKGGIG